jgi:hypothetical protein
MEDIIIHDIIPIEEHISENHIKYNFINQGNNIYNFMIKIELPKLENNNYYIPLAPLKLIKNIKINIPNEKTYEITNSELLLYLHKNFPFDYNEYFYDYSIEKSIEKAKNKDIILIPIKLTSSNKSELIAINYNGLITIDIEWKNLNTVIQNHEEINIPYIKNLNCFMMKNINNLINKHSNFINIKKTTNKLENSIKIYNGSNIIEGITFIITDENEKDNDDDFLIDNISCYINSYQLKKYDANYWHYNTTFTNFKTVPICKNMYYIPLNLYNIDPIDIKLNFTNSNKKIVNILGEFLQFDDINFKEVIIEYDNINVSQNIDQIVEEPVYYNIYDIFNIDNENIYNEVIVI